MSDPKIFPHGEPPAAAQPAKLGCEVCANRTHAKWHDCARGEVNPVALIGFVEGLRATSPAVCDAIVGFVYAITGMDVALMRQMLIGEQPEQTTKDHKATKVAPAAALSPTPTAELLDDIEAFLKMVEWTDRTSEEDAGNLLERVRQAKSAALSPSEEPKK